MLGRQTGFTRFHAHLPNRSAPARSATSADISRVRIAVVDCDESIYFGFKEMLEAKNWDFVFYTDGREAVQQIPVAKPDVVLMDILMPGLSGIDCIQKLKCHSPDLSVTVYTASSTFEDIVLSLMTGAGSYLLKPLSASELERAIMRVLHNGTVLCEEAQSAMLQCFHRAFETMPNSVFSRRELQIIMGLFQKFSDKEIATQLGIAPNTIHVHLVRLFRLLGVHDRNEAVQKFFRGCLGTSCCRCQFSTSGMTMS
jgi:DNA-binding NarL/FixJ family response regulator